MTKEEANARDKIRCLLELYFSMRLNLHRYVMKTGKPLLVKEELQAKLERLCKAWDKLDDQGRSTEQAVLSREIEEVRQLIKLCDNGAEKKCGCGHLNCKICFGQPT